MNDGGSRKEGIDVSDRLTLLPQQTMNFAAQ